MSDYVFSQPMMRNPTDPVGGLTKRELVCILTRVPATGDAELDGIICQAQRRDVAAQALQGLLAKPETSGDFHEFSESAVTHADTLLAALAEPTTHQSE